MNEVKDDSAVDECLNEAKLLCERCSSVILLPQKAVYRNKQCYLPHMKKKSDRSSGEGETLQEFWLVDDMFTFENVGFTNTVEGRKYLICADCEIGPIGYHDLCAAKEFYIAKSRVKTG